MWFTNAFSYKFTKPFDTSIEELEKALQEHIFRPCGSQDQQKQGWVSAIPSTTNLVHAAGNSALICLKTEEKILPSSVVKDALEEKVQDIEAERGQKVGKKEKQTKKIDSPYWYFNWGCLNIIFKIITIFNEVMV